MMFRCLYFGRSKSRGGHASSVTGYWLTKAITQNTCVSTATVNAAGDPATRHAMQTPARLATVTGYSYLIQQRLGVGNIAGLSRRKDEA